MVFELIKKLTGQSYIYTIPREFIVKLDGDVCAALFLSQLIYWSDKGYDEWIFKSYADWEQELGLKKKKVMAIKAKLEMLGLIRTKVKKVNNSPTVHYLLNAEALCNWLVTNRNYPKVPDKDF